MAGVFIVGAIREEIISRGVFTSTADVRLLFHSKTRDTTLDRDMPANPRSPCIKTPVIPSATPDRDTLANPSPPAYCMPIVPDWGPLKGRESALVRPPVPDELSRGGCRPGAVRGLRLCTCGVDFYGRNGKKKNDESLLLQNHAPTLFSSHFHQKFSAFHGSNHLVAGPVGSEQPDPTRPDPTRPDPTRPDPTRPDPTRPDPTRPDPTRPDPTRPHSTHFD